MVQLIQLLGDVPAEAVPPLEGLDEQGGFEDVGDARADQFLGGVPDDLGEHGVRKLDIQGFVDDDDRVGGMLDDVVREARGLFHEEGEAHRDRGLALEDGLGFVAASRVAAGGTVQLVFFGTLAHLA